MGTKMNTFEQVKKRLKNAEVFALRREESCLAQDHVAARGAAVRFSSVAGSAAVRGEAEFGIAPISGILLFCSRKRQVAGTLR